MSYKKYPSLYATIYSNSLLLETLMAPWRNCKIMQIAKHVAAGLYSFLLESLTPLFSLFSLADE